MADPAEHFPQEQDVVKRCEAIPAQHVSAQLALHLVAATVALYWHAAHGAVLAV